MKIRTENSNFILISRSFSLITLFVICCIYFIIFNQKHVQISAIYFPPKIEKADNYMYKTYYYWLEKDYLYKTIDVPINFNKNDAKIFESLVLEMQKSEKEKVGIKFIFKDENTFSDIMNMLQIMENSKQDIHTFYNNYFYVMKSNSDSEKIKMREVAL